MIDIDSLKSYMFDRLSAMNQTDCNDGDIELVLTEFQAIIDYVSGGLKEDA